ncbi:MAG TPA: hypothetical protein VJ784_05675 [Pyrinomonadaceae bacterium]|nr:hypothetical protein [Pyrinomonadaceae bacterium]
MEIRSDSYRFKLFVIIGLALGVLCFMVAGLIIGLDYWWRGRPEYSLHQIGTAVRTHNLHLFRKHVDIRAVSGRLIDDLMSLPPDQAGSVTERSGQALGQAFVELMKPRIVEAFEAQIERYVETGNLNPPNQQNAINAASLQDILNRLGPFEWATIDGNIAVTEMTILPSSKDQKPITLGLKLRRTEDGFWQLMEISLPKEILESVRKTK